MEGMGEELGVVDVLGGHGGGGSEFTCFTGTNNDFTGTHADALGGSGGGGSEVMSVSARGDEGKSICSSSGSVASGERGALWDAILGTHFTCFTSIYIYIYYKR
jgi:hypothetical protein